MMSKDTHKYIQALLQQHGQSLPAQQQALLAAFANSEMMEQAYAEIIRIQQRIMESWKENIDIADVKSKPLPVPNAQVGQPYLFTLDPAKAGLPALSFFDLAVPPESGLVYNAADFTLSGKPLTAGTFPLSFRFRVAASAEDAPLQEKVISLLVNADPKSLWKNLDSDTTDIYWKPDTDQARLAMGDKTLIVASKRGRSHAHEGRFRDDDFGAANLAGGWGIIAVADGAGSAKFSRRGSKIVCDAVVNFFKEKITNAHWADLDNAIVAAQTSATPDHQKTLSRLVIDYLGKAAYDAHQQLNAAAAEKEAPTRDFATTLLFLLVKKFDFGYFVASFMVGDGGMGIYSKDTGQVFTLGTPDGGEFAGQTRFVSMPEIFKDESFYRRFSIRTIPDFTALVLMTDGITDPKFQTDANLTKVEYWNALWDDLQGPEHRVLDRNAAQASQALLDWLDFWSPGNHDDRTIAILF
ncbi:Protein phosphatase 2C [Chitinophaga costaii]|uniref:Protein phosphatase 2C n=1 Tax=Chitinophaga costaii TaxID=1335309 RepID=A0A1C4AQ71_9BACT|nr:protein phosphatase 2C domain-containing protein [Chitinophaga costaii]PUZ26697.1 protein phosphatase 2C domain-containing protein [Chitinophaga costaii]SCB96636.1 Protein phosphatase 2C [Chitinophaga costaii]